MQGEGQIFNPMIIQPPAGAYECSGCQHMFHSESEPLPYIINPPNPIGTNCRNSEISPFTCVKQPDPISTNCQISEISNLSLNLSKSVFDLRIQGTHCFPTNVVAPPGICCPNFPAGNKKTPGDLVDTMEHKCHPGCTLKLAFYPAFIKNEFSCVGCGGDIKDNYVYGCLTCSLKLHVKCAFLPEALSNEEHDTTMNLYYSASFACGAGKSFLCSICGQTNPGNFWVYYCPKCEYGADVSCILAKERLKEELQSYKDAFEPYTSRPSAADNCIRKA